MTVDPVAKLTPKQREVLRLVARGYRSKEIAIELGRNGQTLTSYAVDKRLEAAARALGAPDRFVAARMLEAAENGEDVPSVAYEPFVSEPEALPSWAGTAFLGGVDRQQPGAMREAAVAYTVGPIPELPRWPIPTKGRPLNDLSIAQRIGWTTLLLGVAAGGWGLLLRSIVALSAG